MDGIVSRLRSDLRAHQDAYEVRRSFSEEPSSPVSARLVLSLSCYQYDRATLGSLAVKKVLRMSYKNGPTRVYYSTTGRGLDTFCDASEVLLVMDWHRKPS